MSDKKHWSLPGAHFGGDPEFFSAWTLFDISMDSQGSQENLRRFIELVSARGQPILAGVEMVTDQQIDGGFFGSEFPGRHTVWCYKWIVDKVGLMSEETLLAESAGTPMIIGLKETAALDREIITSGPRANTFFIRHDSL
jgi:hypothetical protein